MAAGQWHENHALLALRLRLSALGLILLSFVAYFFPQLIGGKKRHWHALIPGVLGVLFLPCSFGVQKESTRKIAAHVAVLVAVRNFSIIIIIAHALLPLSKLVTCSFYSSSHSFLRLAAAVGWRVRGHQWSVQAHACGYGGGDG